MPPINPADLIVLEFLKYDLSPLTEREISAMIKTGSKPTRVQRSERFLEKVDWKFKGAVLLSPQGKKFVDLQKQVMRIEENGIKYRNAPAKYVFNKRGDVFLKINLPSVDDKQLESWIKTGLVNIGKYPSAISKSIDIASLKSHPQHDEMQDYVRKLDIRIRDAKKHLTREQTRKTFSRATNYSTFAQSIIALRKYAREELGLPLKYVKDYIEPIFMEELERAGVRMLAEARRLVPAPATVPRVTVPSLAGRDFSYKYNRENKVWEPTRPVQMRKKASRYLTAALGFERVERLSKYGFIDVSLPTERQIKRAGGKRAFAAQGRQEAKRTTSLHMSGKRLHESHKTDMDGRSTGKLRSSLFFRVTKEYDIVMGANNTEYWTDVEFGTGKRGKDYNHPPKIGRGKYCYVGKGVTRESTARDGYNMRKPGMRAQPYIYPSYMKEVKPFFSRVRRIIDKMAETYHNGGQGKLL
jgi:hypothetical protein